jgi:hypothetical protein
MFVFAALDIGSVDAFTSACNAGMEAAALALVASFKMSRRVMDAIPADSTR